MQNMIQTMPKTLVTGIVSAILAVGASLGFDWSVYEQAIGGAAALGVTAIVYFVPEASKARLFNLARQYVGGSKEKVEEFRQILDNLEDAIDAGVDQ